MAIDHAHTILRWEENLLPEEMPPSWMWHLDHELEPWFEEVRRNRESRYGGGRDDAGDEEAPMMANELAAEMRRR